MVNEIGIRDLDTLEGLRKKLDTAKSPELSRKLVHFFENVVL